MFLWLFPIAIYIKTPPDLQAPTPPAWPPQVANETAHPFCCPNAHELRPMPGTQPRIPACESRPGARCRSSLSQAFAAAGIPGILRA